ncbi:MAG TPA: hypothetical protein VJ810_31455 [Blastocatellia bacterium]|nr:hypothetical protein [Blastocatellia bacterium]
MPNEDNNQHLSDPNNQVIAAIRALEDRIVNVEGMIVASLNDTRPLEREILARLNELNIGQSTMQEQVGDIQEQIGAIQEHMLTREDFENFRRETNGNFRLINDKLDVLNDDVLSVRARQRDLEKRVIALEQDSI